MFDLRWPAGDQLGGFVAIGPGSGSLAQDARRAGFKRAISLDPLVEDVWRDGDPRFVLPVRDMARSGEAATFHALNLVDLSSAADPEPLRRRHPGLRVRRRIPIDPVPLGEVVHEALEGMGEDEAHWLVLNAPGLEKGLLEDLVAEGLHDRLARVVVRTGEGDPFGRGSDPERLKGLLGEAGWRVTTHATQDDWDWPVLHGEPDPRAAEIAALRGTLRKEAEERQRAEAERDEALARIAADEAALSKVETLEANLAVALRMQALGQSDLRELRERYGKLHDEKGERDALILKLTERLGQAANYLKLADHETIERPEPLAPPRSHGAHRREVDPE